ncbi:MAG: gliding motility-associated C-terminal domain-containing protein [Chitinophagales bacterium]|nr:gliding motility-associated C-terminal domain-containing protein [Chitinophagales bacterium]
MRKLYLFLVFAIVFNAAQSQQTTFRIQYNLGEFDIPTGMVQAPNTNYVFSAMVTRNFSGLPLGVQGGLVQIDKNGNHISSTLYRNGSFTSSVDLADVQNATGGGYIVTGSANSQCLVARLTATGAITWHYRYIPVSGANSYGNKVIQASDGGFVIAGVASRVDPDGGGPITRQDSSKMYAFKVNSSGTVLWSKVFFYTTAFDDDDYLNGLAETSDGYVFVGSATMSAGNGNSDAVVIKTDFNGNVQWARRFGNSNSEDVQSVIRDSGNDIVMTGIDNLGGYIYNWSAPNSGPTVIGTNTRYYAAGLPVSAGNLTKTHDNNFAVFASGASLNNFTSILVKSNRSTGAVMFARSYNSFISILPTGIMAADSGFLINSLSADTTGSLGFYDFGVTKTDINGTQGTGSTCPHSTPAILAQTYSPSINTFTPTVPALTDVRNSGGVTTTTITPGVVVGCKFIVCNAPPAPSASASQNNICPGTQVTISATGGSNVTYKVYLQASGGNSIGNAPLNVTPSSTTTYYVAADDNTNPGCESSRTPVTVTVIQPPAAIGNITGATNPCPGTQSYSISAVTGATSYTWALSGGGTITGGQGTTSINVNWTAAGTYTVSVTATNTCGSTNKTLSVTVQAGPPAAVGTITGSNNPCPGSQTYTISNVANATSYTWTVSGGGTITGGQGTTSLTVNWTTPGGPYIVSVSASNPCGNTSNSLNVTVQNAAPGTLGNITGPATPCLGSQTYSVTAVSGSPTYTWSVSGGGTITGGQGTTSVTVNWTTAGGPYTVSVTASNPCGNNSKTLAVTVSPAITGVAASATPNPACVGNSVTLNGSGSGVTTWSWAGPNNYSSNLQSPSISSITSAGGGTYTLTASSACGTATATVNLVVNDVPQNVSASASPNPACAGNTVLLSGSGTGATSWSWSGPDNFSSAQQSPSLPNAQTSATGTYTLTASNACGNATTTVNVTVNDIPLSVTATANPNPVCDGTVLNLSGTANGATTYAWSGPNNFSSTQLNATINNFQLANAGTYNLTATNSCGSANASVTVTHATVPTNVVASASVTNICFGNSLTLSGNASGADSYSWTGPNGFSSTQQNPPIQNITLADSGVYTLTATNTCGSTTATIVIDVDTTIESISAGASPNDTICAGQNITLTATGDNVNNWTWTGPNNFISNQQSPTITNATAVNSGEYLLVGSNACNDVLDTLYVLVNTIPITPGTIIGSVSACGSDTAIYTVNGISNATSYNWSLSGGGSIISGQGTTSIEVLWGGAPGNYTVSVTAGNSCGNSTATSITVNVLPPAPVMTAIIVGETEVCPGVEPYSVTSIPNATGYTWTVSSGGTITSGQGTNSVNVLWATAGSQTLNVIATNTCGSSSPATINVTVHPSPTPATVVLTDDTICEGSSTTLTASGSTGGNVSYHFYDAPVGGNMYATHPLTVSPTQTTTYYLEVINQFGCTGSAGRQPVTVYVIPAPAILNIAAQSDTICYNTSTIITAAATPGSQITWWDSPVGGNQIGTGSTYNTGNLLFTTTVYAQATSQGGCQNLQGRVPATVTVTPLPVVTLTTDKDNNIAFPNEAITFTASPDGYSNYEFFVNSVSVQSGTKNTWASAKLHDKDTVSVIATDNGCQSLKAEVVVTIADLPNAFTPNGDGVNDIFLKDYDLVVLNRWGQELYRGFDGWDGKYNGQKVSAGTYYYIVTLRNITDRDTQVKGTVLLIQE